MNSRRDIVRVISCLGVAALQTYSLQLFRKKIHETVLTISRQRCAIKKSCVDGFLFILTSCKTLYPDFYTVIGSYRQSKFAKREKLT